MCNWLEIPGAIAGGYLIGSLPIGYILVKLKTDKDVRDSGSGGIGATNVSRIMGKEIGVLVAVFDILKGILAYYLGAALLQEHGTAELTAVSAVVGHCFPVWIGFKGGKGVSTAFGATLVLATLPAVIAIAVFAAALSVAKRVSAASLTAVWTFAGLLFLLEVGIPIRIMGIFLALFVTFTHRENLERLMKGAEKPIVGDR